MLPSCAPDVIEIVAARATYLKFCRIVWKIANTSVAGHTVVRAVYRLTECRLIDVDTLTL
jgi:hypothetical protein